MPDTVDVRVFKEGLTVRAKDWAATVVWPLRLETEGGPALPGLAEDWSPPDRKWGWYYQHPGNYVNVCGSLNTALSQIALDAAAHGLTEAQAEYLRTISGPFPWTVDMFEMIPEGPPPRVVSTRTIYDEIKGRFRVGWHSLPAIDVKTRYPRVWN